MEVHKYDDDSFIIGEEIRHYVVQQLHLPNSFRTEDLGKILKDYHLLKGIPKVKWVFWKDDKVQKTCYRINLPGINTLIKKNEIFIDQSPPVIAEHDTFKYIDYLNSGPNPSPRRCDRTPKLW